MNMNFVYAVVTLLTFFSFINYINCNEPSKGWVKQIHFIMQVIFFIANLIGLLFINENPYKQENTAITFLMYLLYIIPILIYVIQFFEYMREQKSIDKPVFWAIYLVCFIILLIVPKQINSEKILPEKADILSYSEYEVKSTFLNDSIEGTDYVIVIETSKGEIIKQIIETRTYRENNDIVRLHLHQKNSYIEEYVTKETYLYFIGFTNKQIKEEKIYEIYLTDNMYEQK